MSEPANPSLADQLAERGLSMMIHTPPAETEPWVVWLFASDDPALGAYVGEGDELPDAIDDALAKWDGAAGEEVVDAPAAVEEEKPS